MTSLTLQPHKKTLSAKWVWAIILFTWVVKSIVACGTELSNDEVYYVQYAFYPDWNYFDHPPLVGLCIRFSTLGLMLKQEWFIRLSGLIFSLANMYLIFKTTALLKNKNAGYLAALLYNSSIYANVITGLLILPDTPMLFFWLLSLYYAVKIFASEKGYAIPKKNFFLLSISIGLCMLSKIHGVLIWGCLGFYILFFDRRWLRVKLIYVSFFLSLIFLAPIVGWNIANHFMTFQYHGGRVSEHGFHLQTDSFLREIFGGFAYQNPINYVLYVIAVVACIRGGIRLNRRKKIFLLCMSLPVIALFLVLSLFMDTLPHWSGPGFCALIILTAIYLTDKLLNNHFFIPKSVMAANALVIVGLIAAFILVRFAPVNLGNKDEKKLGENDFTLDMMGWKKFGKDFKQLVQTDSSTHATKGPVTVISNKWFPASHLDLYVARPNHYNFLAIGEVHDIHQFYFINQTKPALQKGNDAYYITTTNFFNDPLPIYKDKFESIDEAVKIPQYKSGKLMRYFLVYRCRGTKETLQ